MTKTRMWADRLVLAAAALAAVAAVVPGTLAQECRRDEWQKTDEIFRAMGVRDGTAVADIGAGDGYLTTRLAAAVGPAGHVYAVDVSDSQLERLRRRLAESEVTNVTVIQGANDDPRLPAGTLDAAVIINAYHEMHEHQAMLAGIRRALKPEGRLVIVEPVTDRRRGQPRAELARAHEMAPEYVVAEARAAGFRIVGLQDPFTFREPDLEWLIVLQPDNRESVQAPAAASDSPPAPARPADIDDPALRITLDELKALLAAGPVTIVDVRDARSFEQAHAAGALLLPLADLSAGAERLRRLGAPIVTYCS